MTKPRNDRSQAVTRFCLAMEEHRRSEAGRVRTAKEFVTQFFPYDEAKAKDRLFVHIPKDVRGPVLSAWGIRGAKAAVRDDDEKIADVVHDALVAGDIDESIFEEGVTAQIVVDWIALNDWWSFWRQGKLSGVAIQKALATARELGLIDDKWFLSNVQGRGGKLKGTDVVCDTLSKDQIVAWIRRVHESGDGSPAGIIAAVGWEVVLAKTAQDALLFALDAFARKAGLVVDPPPETKTEAATSSTTSAFKAGSTSIGPASLGSSSFATGATSATAATAATAPSSIASTSLASSQASTSVGPASIASSGFATSASTIATSATSTAASATSATSTAASPNGNGTATTTTNASGEPPTARHDKLADGHPTVNAPHNIIAAAEAEIIRAQVSKAERERRDSGAIPAVVGPVPVSIANMTAGVNGANAAALTPQAPPVSTSNPDDEDRPSIPTVNGERAPFAPEEESPKLAEARAAMMATLMQSTAPSEREPWQESEVPAKPSSLEWPDHPPVVINVPLAGALPTATGIGGASASLGANGADAPDAPPSDDFISIDTFEDEDVRSEQAPQPKAPTVPPPLPTRSGPRAS